MIDDIQAQEPDAMRISFNKTPSNYKPYAVALGDRLLVAGKERIVATGLLGYAENLDKPLPVEIVWEYPLKVRLAQDGSSLAFNGFDAGRKAPESPRLTETLEVLLEDSAEGFMFLQSTPGVTVCHDGSDYKLAGSDPKSPAIDIVRMKIADVVRGGRPVEKTYWFDSASKLLGYVGYLSESGSEVRVVIDDWRDAGWAKVPFLIERWEDDKLTMRLTLSSAVAMAGAKDGIFEEK